MASWPGVQVGPFGGEVVIAELEPKDIEMLNPFLAEMQELVRAKKVYVHREQVEVNADWHENKLDKKKVYVAVL